MMEAYRGMANRQCGEREARLRRRLEEYKSSVKELERSFKRHVLKKLRGVVARIRANHDNKDHKTTV